MYSISMEALARARERLTASLRATNRYLPSKIDTTAIMAVNAAFGVVDAGAEEAVA